MRVQVWVAGAHMELCAGNKHAAQQLIDRALKDVSFMCHVIENAHRMQLRDLLREWICSLQAEISGKATMHFRFYGTH